MSAAIEEGQQVVDAISVVVPVVVAAPKGDREAMAANLASLATRDLLVFMASIMVVQIVAVIVRGELDRRNADDVNVTLDQLKTEAHVRRQLDTVNGSSLYGS